MQLAGRCQEDDLRQFFEEHAGKVNVSHIVTDRNSRRSKGIAYIEFEVRSQAPLTLAVWCTCRPCAVSVDSTLVLTGLSSSLKLRWPRRFSAQDNGCWVCP